MEVIFDCRNITDKKVFLFLDNGQTVSGESLNKALANAQEARQQVEKPPVVTKVVPQELSVTNLCFCGAIIPGKRVDRRYCSPRCRQQASRSIRKVLTSV